jgi:hypothetical protein
MTKTSIERPVLMTTLQRLKEAGACADRYAHLRKALGKDYSLDTPLPLVRILETNGRDDLFWALGNAVDGGRQVLQLWAADCAERVLPIFLKEYPNDNRPSEAVKAARQFARGEITDAAWDAARAAACAAARAAAWDAARAAARAAAWDAARAAARAAAWDAARAAAWDAASDAASDAAWAAARAAEEKWQTNRLIEYLDGKQAA